MNTTTDVAHPADAYGKKDPTKVPITSILHKLDAELSGRQQRIAESSKDREELEAFIRPQYRADDRLEEIARLLLSLPFGEMLKLGGEMVKCAPPIEEGKPELPANINMAMSLDRWAKDKMEERDGSVRETP